MPIRHHHKPEEMGSTDPKYEIMTKILHVAALFVDLLHLPDRAISLRALDESLSALVPGKTINPEDLAKRVYAKTSEIFPLFEIKSNDENDYAEIVDEARKELIELSFGIHHTDRCTQTGNRGLEAPGDAGRVNRTL